MLRHKDEIRDLRLEYGYRLLAEQVAVEQAQQDRDEAIKERDEARTNLRTVTTTLQRCYDASEVLNDALYGVGR